MKNTADTALNAGDYPTRYALGMKCNIETVIDEVKVYLNGKSIITPSGFKQIWSNVRAMAELTTAEVEKHGTNMFQFPDDWESIKHANTSNANGDGYSNNSHADNSSLALTTGGIEPTRSNTGFLRRVLNNPPEVAGLNNSYGWPSLNKTTSQAIAQMRGTGGFKKGPSLTQGSTRTKLYASPFDSAPWTFQPGSSIRDFQVQVGNKNVFQDVHSYDWMTFLDEFSKLSAVNGDLSREISNGLIGMDKWQAAQRILVADCSRIGETDVPQSIKISGTNIANQGTNLLVLVVYERSLEFDRTTGEIYKAE
ncbi:unnamed protein product [Phytophthora fragariaefolia]|uniref:Unnamed protein product n=1 Tax=Phytophthora fragariaefolia TaxID=1490495 RepID=A0A9W6XFD6_9STRA|nr:unnamed protein product [Phytophthora fragariaefolia]